MNQQDPYVYTQLALDMAQEDAWARGHAEGTQHGYQLAVGAIITALEEKMNTPNAVQYPTFLLGLGEALKMVKRMRRD